MKAVILGAGNLASSLAPALARAGVEIVQVFSRTEQSAARLALCLNNLQATCVLTTTSLKDIKPDAELYIYAIRDDALPEVIEQVAALGCGGEALHMHTSGSAPLQTLSKWFRRAAVFYPFQTFTLNAEVDFSHVPLFIEATDELTLGQVRTIALLLTQNIYVADESQRKRLHIAGVFANNFSNAMFAIASEQLQRAGLPFSVLLPLITQTAQKVHRMSPKQAQTGPAARHDLGTIAEHLEKLSGQEQQIYQLLTDYILQNINPDSEELN